jgi:voltage-gated sodium channel
MQSDTHSSPDKVVRFSFASTGSSLDDDEVCQTNVDKCEQKSPSALKASTRSESGCFDHADTTDRPSFVRCKSWIQKDRNAFDHLAQEELEPVQRANEALLADADSMKLKVRVALLNEQYDVQAFYKTTGWASLLAKHEWFENATLLVIAFNAFWIAVDIDHGEPIVSDAHPFFQAVAHFFCAFFTGELLTRFLAFRAKRNAFKDSWFVFDFSLVVVMVVETWVFPILFLMFNISASGLRNTQVLRLLKLARLTRIARMARLMSAFPEVMVIITGIKVASRAVFVTMVLLCFVIYIFAIVFTQMTGDSDLGEEFFGNVPASMWTLFIQGNFPDLGSICEEIGKSHAYLMIIFFMFVLLSAVTLLNMLVGILVDVVRSVAAAEKEKIVVTNVRDRLRLAMGIDGEGGVDADQDGRITRDEFEQIILKPDAARMIQSVGVDVVELVDDAEFIFSMSTLALTSRIL